MVGKKINATGINVGPRLAEGSLPIRIRQYCAEPSIVEYGVHKVQSRVTYSVQMNSAGRPIIAQLVGAHLSGRATSVMAPKSLCTRSEKQPYGPGPVSGSHHFGAGPMTIWHEKQEAGPLNLGLCIQME